MPGRRLTTRQRRNKQETNMSISDDELLGFECDIEDCENRIVGLDDGWKMPRGHCCQDCIEFEMEHGHWPDEDQLGCRICHVEDGGIVHECPESSVDAVLLHPGDECSICEEVVEAA